MSQEQPPRDSGVDAVQAAGRRRKTECKRGHALAGDNLYYHPRGERQCRACKAIISKASYDRKALTRVPAWSRPSVAERFAECVRKDDRSGCILWIGSIATNGYGRMKIGRRFFQAHRVSWELVNGPIPPGMFICHRCDIRPCVNPLHLFVGTQADNMRDCAAKGRLSGQRRLTEDLVSTARRRHRGGESISGIALDMGFAWATISWAIKGRTRSHVTNGGSP